MTDPFAATTPARRLEAERQLLLERLQSMRRDHLGMMEASAGSNADDEHDPEGATIAFERSQLSALIDQVSRHLGEVEAARVRVDRGTYGVCEQCAQSIAPVRLEARPSGRLCVECAQRQGR